MERNITVLQLSVLMSAYTNGNYDTYDDTPIYRDQVEHLLDVGLIVAKNHSTLDYKYTCTAKGIFYMEYLLSTPFPSQKWEIAR